MGNIRIGTIIATKRKEKGITQEELAQHLKVSKPAVSKWESGQSYPDIVLLPLLAAFFNISVDELIGYEPQMTLTDIRKLYKKLADDFAKDPFDQVYIEIEFYIKKYFSCWQLQIQMGLLLINHLNLTGSVERTTQVTEEILEMYKRVSRSCEDVKLTKQALQYQALCHLCLNDPISAIDILENLNDPMLSPETLLIKAYQMRGDHKKAKESLQGYSYISLMNIIGATPDFLLLYAEDPNKVDVYYQKFLEVTKVFDVENFHPAVMLQVYLAAAQVYVMQDRKNKALDALEQYVSVVMHMDKDDFHLKGNAYFDALEGYFASIEIETSAPRNADVIRKDIKNIIIANPVFAPLETEERFRKLKKRAELEL